MFNDKWQEPQDIAFCKNITSVHYIITGKSPTHTVTDSIPTSMITFRLSLLWVLSAVRLRTCLNPCNIICVWQHSLQNLKAHLQFLKSIFVSILLPET